MATEPVRTLCVCCREFLLLDDVTAIVLEKNALVRRVVELEAENEKLKDQRDQLARTFLGPGRTTLRGPPAGG